MNNFGTWNFYFLGASSFKRWCIFAVLNTWCWPTNLLASWPGVRSEMFCLTPSEIAPVVAGGAEKKEGCRWKVVVVVEGCGLTCAVSTVSCIRHWIIALQT